MLAAALLSAAGCTPPPPAATDTRARPGAAAATGAAGTPTAAPPAAEPMPAPAIAPDAARPSLLRRLWTAVWPWAKRDGPPAPPLPPDAPDPGDVPYTTEIVPTGDGALDTALTGASQLLRLQTVAPTTAFGIVARAREDRERLAQALHGEGYWGAEVQITLAGIPLAAPDLEERLDAARARPVPVRVVVTPRPQYGIGTITVRAAAAEHEAVVAEAAAQPFGVAPGDPARAAPVLAAERTLLDRLLAAGHPLASVVRREAVVDYDTRTMDVAWVFAPGPAATFAPPVVTGAVRVDAAFLNRYADARLADELYSPQRLERARRDIAALGPFGSVRTQAGTALDAQGRLPVAFVVTERPFRALSANLAYETNYGPSVRLSWEHRNLFGGAERLRLEGEVARIGVGGTNTGTGLEGMTYRAFATLRDPRTLVDQQVTIAYTLGALRERLLAYDRDAVVGSALFERRFSERLTAFAGPTAEFGQSGPPGGPLRAYQVVGFTFGGRYDATDSLLDPARGWRLNGAVTPSYSLERSAPFAPLRVTGTTYWDVLGDRRSILALRGTVGSLLGAERTDVPEPQRFYAGGGGSVRGYDYQSIGPRDRARNIPTGGASLLEASLEWRQRIVGDWGAVAFVDAGSVGESSAPSLSDLRVGVGVGVRYYTAIGPIRADVALPLVRQQGSSGYGLYVGIGQAF